MFGDSDASLGEVRFNKREDQNTAAQKRIGPLMRRLATGSDERCGRLLRFSTVQHADKLVVTTWIADRNDGPYDVLATQQTNEFCALLIANACGIPSGQQTLVDLKTPLTPVTAVRKVVFDEELEGLSYGESEKVDRLFVEATVSAEAQQADREPPVLNKDELGKLFGKIGYGVKLWSDASPFANVKLFEVELHTPEDDDCKPVAESNAELEAEKEQDLKFDTKDESFGEKDDVLVLAASDAAVATERRQKLQPLVAPIPAPVPRQRAPKPSKSDRPPKLSQQEILNLQLMSKLEVKEAPWNLKENDENWFTRPPWPASNKANPKWEMEDVVLLYQWAAKNKGTPMWKTAIKKLQQSADTRASWLKKFYLEVLPGLRKEAEEANERSVEEEANALFGDARLGGDAAEEDAGERPEATDEADEPAGEADEADEADAAGDEAVEEEAVDQEDDAPLPAPPPLLAEQDPAVEGELELPDWIVAELGNQRVDDYEAQELEAIYRQAPNKPALDDMTDAEKRDWIADMLDFIRG